MSDNTINQKPFTPSYPRLELGIMVPSTSISNKSAEPLNNEKFFFEFSPEIAFYRNDRFSISGGAQLFFNIPNYDSLAGSVSTGIHYALSPSSRNFAPVLEPHLYAGAAAFLPSVEGDGTDIAAFAKAGASLHFAVNRSDNRSFWVSADTYLGMEPFNPAIEVSLGFSSSRY